MPAKESRYSADWLAKAQKDWQRVEPRLRDNDVEDAAFHLHQAVEKYLKGYLRASHPSGQSADPKDHFGSQIGRI
jgi:HEPN domain-containing protein